MTKRDEEEKKDVSSLFEIKHLIEKGSTTVLAKEGEGGVGKIYSELENLNKRFEELRDIVVGLNKKTNTPKKKKVKMRIIMILEEKKKMNSAQLGRELKLSRVRANEYLREMEEEGLVRGIKIKRKRFYLLDSSIIGKSYSKSQEDEGN